MNVPKFQVTNWGFFFQGKSQMWRESKKKKFLFLSKFETGIINFTSKICLKMVKVDTSAPDAARQCSKKEKVFFPEEDKFTKYLDTQAMGC